MNNINIKSLADKINSLPGNLFSLKSDYLKHIPNIDLLDVDGAFVKLGQAGERIAKGILDTKSVDYYKESSFDRLIQALSDNEVPVPIIVGLRTVLKYRNQAAHDNLSILSIHDLDAAVGAFCASYRSTWDLTEGEINIFNLTDSKNPLSQYRGVVSETPAKSTNLQTFNIPNVNILLTLSCFITGSLLVKAVISGGSSSFFMFLRLVVTASSIFLSLDLFRKHKYLVLLIAVGIAILFNPLIIIQLSRDIWRIIDLAVMCWFIYWGLQFAKHR